MFDFHTKLFIIPWIMGLLLRKLFPLLLQWS